MDQSSSESERRRSQRCLYPAPQAVNKSKGKTGPFLNEEKEQILCALYAYGPNVDKIAPLLSGRSREQVRDFLTSWFRRVKKVPVVLSERDYQTMMIKEPIEVWLEKIKKEVKDNKTSNDGTLPCPWYPYAVGYIAKYEIHPHPTETGGVDFKRLYEYLETMLSGNVPSDLSYADALFMLSSLRKLKFRLEKVDFHKDEVHIKRSSSSQGSASQPRTYKRIKKEESDEDQASTNEVEALLLSKTMNPLKMPIESLSIKERIKTQCTL